MLAAGEVSFMGHCLANAFLAMGIGVKVLDDCPSSKIENIQRLFKKDRPEFVRIDLHVPRIACRAVLGKNVELLLERHDRQVLPDQEQRYGASVLQQTTNRAEGGYTV